MPARFQEAQPHDQSEGDGSRQGHARPMVPASPSGALAEKVPHASKLEFALGRGLPPFHRDASFGEPASHDEVLLILTPIARKSFHPLSEAQCTIALYRCL